MPADEIYYLKQYRGIVPACGVFCGGCPNYVRDRKPCPGASEANRCGRCKFHLCCAGRGINHCFECEGFPCQHFKRFAWSWKKYGQDFMANQHLLKEIGEKKFLAQWNNGGRNVTRLENDKGDGKRDQ